MRNHVTRTCRVYKVDVTLYNPATKTVSEDIIETMEQPTDLTMKATYAENEEKLVDWTVNSVEEELRAMPYPVFLEHSFVVTPVEVLAEEEEE